MKRTGDWNAYLKQTLAADPELAEEYRKQMESDSEIRISSDAPRSMTGIPNASMPTAWNLKGPMLNQEGGRDVALSLLVIDLGDCCVVKVEKGSWPAHLLQDCDREYEYGDRCDLSIYQKPFPDLRAALDGEKPVPRIEFDGHWYTLFYKNYALVEPESSIGLANGGYDALSQLAGHPLPIWEGNGKWEELNPPAQLGIGWELPFTAWRYTR